MAVSSFPRAFSTFECRSDPEFTRPEIPRPGSGGFYGKSKSASMPAASSTYRWSSLIFKFPPNFVRQLSIKARRNCSNIGVAQVVAASWANNQGASGPASMAKAVDVAAAAVAPVEILTGVEDAVIEAADPCCNKENVQLGGVPSPKYDFFLNSDGSIAIHAGERLGRGIVTDAITTPVVNTSAYFFKKTEDLIAFKEKRSVSYEYGRYGNYTTEAAEQKISALERAESTLFVASGMYATTQMLTALIPKGGHLVTTTDCYRKTRKFIETVLPEKDISTTIIDPADIGGLESALEKHNVSLFFTETPTNPFLRCVDIERVAKLCHKKGTLVCIDGTFATPLNQKALDLGADIVVHSATKYIGGHNDVLAGCISGPEKLISVIRDLHFMCGGALNPNAAYLLIRGMKTMHLRVRQQNSTAQRMAELLEAHPKIRRVYYPGLASHPEHELAKRQMNGFGGVVSFEVDGDFWTTAKFIDALKIPYIAPSFGGCESIVDQPALMSYWDLPESERLKYGISDNLVRFSFGLEDFDDLKNDTLQALEAMGI